MPSLISSGSANDLTQIRRTALGLISETTDINPCSNNDLQVTQTLRCVLIPLKAGTTVTTIVTFLSVAASGLTTAQYCLYKKDGTLLANSANSTGSFGGTQVYVPLNLTTPYTVPADDGYYVGGLFIGTTPPTFLRGNGITGVAAAINSGMKWSVEQAAQASLPATATFTAVVRGTWWGVY